MMEENFENENIGTEETEDKEVEMMEFSLNSDEIDDLIVKLVTLKQTRESFNFEVDDENEFTISYADDEDDSEGDEENVQ